MSDDYSQPQFYRFNSDSITLIDRIVQKRFQVGSIMDLGTGCGIIGLELVRRIKTEKLVLVELQREYLVHLEDNCRRFLPSEVEVSILITSFGELQLSQEFDLIVSNPPYYFPHSGVLSKDLNRARARAFLVDSLEILLQKIAYFLAPEVHAFLVLKNDETLLKTAEKQAIHAGLASTQSLVNGVMILELFALNKK
jgi:tRNA1(Val) A37 N6-methylase TrmN6